MVDLLYFLLGFLTFDLEKYQRDKQINAQNNAVDERDDYQDDYIEPPFQMNNDTEPSFQMNDDISDDPEEINVDEELIHPMSQLRWVLSLCLNANF